MNTEHPRDLGVIHEVLDWRWCAGGTSLSSNHNDCLYLNHAFWRWAAPRSDSVLLRPSLYSGAFEPKACQAFFLGVFAPSEVFPPQH